MFRMSILLWISLYTSFEFEFLRFSFILLLKSLPRYSSYSESCGCFYFFCLVSSSSRPLTLDSRNWLRSFISFNTSRIFFISLLLKNMRLWFLDFFPVLASILLLSFNRFWPETSCQLPVAVPCWKLQFAFEHWSSGNLGQDGIPLGNSWCGWYGLRNCCCLDTSGKCQSAPTLAVVKPFCPWQLEQHLHRLE